MFKKLIAIAAVVALPGVASAVTVGAENNYAAALALVTPADSLTLPGPATWTAAPLTIDPDISKSGEYRSPYETAGYDSAGYWSVGVSADYSETANPAELALNRVSKSLSLLWGSPDGYNKLELWNNGTQVGNAILGSQFTTVAREASFVTISADNASEYFDTVKFYSVSQNAFEFSNLNVAPVPLPAAGFLLMGALAGFGALRRRKKA